MPSIVKTPNFVISAPGDDELGYPGFIGCLLSLAIVGRKQLAAGIKVDKAESSAFKPP